MPVVGYVKLGSGRKYTVMVNEFLRCFCGPPLETKLHVLYTSKTFPWAHRKSSSACL